MEENKEGKRDEQKAKGNEKGEKIEGQKRRKQNKQTNKKDDGIGTK